MSASRSRRLRSRENNRPAGVPAAKVTGRRVAEYTPADLPTKLRRLKQDKEGGRERRAGGGRLPAARRLPRLQYVRDPRPLLPRRRLQRLRRREPRRRVYPQATSWRRLTDPSGLTASPDGCWDWWGYAGDDAYFTRDGKQMRAVRAMIARMLP